MSNGRKVSTDALETLGTIITDKEKRDAIHIAVLPIEASEKMYPGQRISVVDGKAKLGGDTTGIVDPFLTDAVFPGQRFWMLLYPRMVTSLRHVWSHPAFADDADSESPLAAAKRWLTDFAGTAGISLEELLQGAKDHVEHGEYLIQGGRWEGFYTPDEFWQHYEIFTGTKVDPENRGNFFSCTC